MKIIKNLLLTTTICASLTATTFASTPFTDLAETSWAEGYIQTAYDAGCVSGATETTFNPTGKLTMAEFSVMLTKAWYGTELAAEMSKHNDGQWGDNYINTLKNQYSGSFSSTINSIGSYESLSRYEASYIIGMFLVDKEIADYSADFSGSLEKFTDISLETTEETLLSITIANNIMSGKSETSFDGTGTLTRAEACVIISKLIDLEESGLERDTFNEENVTEKPVEEEVVVPSGNIPEGVIKVEYTDTDILYWFDGGNRPISQSSLDRLEAGIYDANTALGDWKS